MSITRDWAQGASASDWGRPKSLPVRARIIQGKGHRLRETYDQDLSRSPAAGVLGAITSRVLAVESLCARGQAGLVPLLPQQTHLALSLIKMVQPASLNLLPSVVPSHRGDLQLDWSLPDMVIEVLFAPVGKANLLIETREGDEIYDGPLDADGVHSLREALNQADTAQRA